MILVFGGAYQGKLDYALNRFSLTEDDIYRCSASDTAMPENKKLVYELDKWIFALVQADGVGDALDRFVRANPAAIVICNDISCGVVPADAQQRQWREAVGRSLATLARTSDEVIRLFCGLPTHLK